MSVRVAPGPRGGQITTHFPLGSGWFRKGHADFFCKELSWRVCMGTQGGCFRPQVGGSAENEDNVEEDSGVRGQVLDGIIPMPGWGHASYMCQPSPQELELVGVESVGVCDRNKEECSRPLLWLLCKGSFELHSVCPPFRTQLKLHPPGHPSDPQTVLFPLTFPEHEARSLDENTLHQASAAVRFARLSALM